MLIFPCLPLCITVKALRGDGLPDTQESPLVVCFGEMLIDFVPTTSGLSLAEAPAFKKAPGGAPANVAVGIARLGGSSAFIGKVQYYIIFLDLMVNLMCLLSSLFPLYIFLKYSSLAGIISFIFLPAICT